MARRKISSVYSEESDDADEYQESKRRKTGQESTRKRRKAAGEGELSDLDPEQFWTPISALESNEGPKTFEDIVEKDISGLLEVRQSHLEALIEVNYLGQRLRPLTISEAASLATHLEDSATSTGNNALDRLLTRKLKLEKYRRRHSLSQRKPRLNLPIPALTAPLANPAASSPDPSIIDGLTMIKTTPLASSFAARLIRSDLKEEPVFLHRDWSARSYWMDLMDDIHEHFTFSHPEREQIIRAPASIDYQTLRPSHLPQVHELLSRTFWPGIDVSDALQYSPELCTVVATFKQLVVGAAFLCSPQETYITYLAVRAGWESSHIATIMLHTLLERNPSKDILLHVSVNNPAMLLYNRFGFKAEEFIVGFYEDYLDAHSRASKNAFRLRLRRSVLKAHARPAGQLNIKYAVNGLYDYRFRSPGSFIICDEGKLREKYR